MNRRSFARATTLVTALAIGSKLLGFVRDQVIALYFGASGRTDAYVVAMTIPALISGILVGPVGTAFLPVFSERLAGKDREGAWALSDIVFTLTGGVAFVLAAFGLAAAPWLVRLMAPGFSGDTYRLAVTATRIVFPAIALASLAGPLKAELNSFHHFTAPAAGPILQNATTLAALVGLVGLAGMGVEGLAIGFSAGMALSAIAQFPALVHRGFRYRPRLDLNDPGVRRTIALAGPLVLGALFSQAYVLVDRGLASGLPAGSIAALNFADKLRQLPLGIFVAAVATVIYPSLSEMAARNDRAGLQDVLGTGLRLVALVTVPAAVGLIVLRQPIVRLLFQHGAFDAAATLTTSSALLYYAVGMVGLAANLVLMTVFYSLRDTVTPVFISAGGTVLNIALDYLLVGPMAHTGLALANSVSALAVTAFLLFGLRRRLGSLRYGETGTALTKILAASAAMALVLLVLQRWPILGGAGLRGQLLSLGLAVAIGGATYLVGVLALRVEEANLIRGVASRVLRRIGRSPQP
ncbi:MAG: murein biosynthesis integral membrane protein MurJ [Symbiobacteriia bacterium]